MTTDRPPQHLIVGPPAIASAEEQIRFNRDGTVCMVYRDGEPVRCPTGDDMDRLPVGDDMDEDEVDNLDS